MENSTGETRDEYAARMKAQPAFEAETPQTLAEYIAMHTEATGEAPDLNGRGMTAETYPLLMELSRMATLRRAAEAREEQLIRRLSAMKVIGVQKEIAARTGRSVAGIRKMVNTPPKTEGKGSTASAA
ncbi:hypothetical protein ACFV9E_09025 [Streptomyces sp. NPDC059835]|uniref:hypothetical protein n=1 Tax=Streptomyces sp. NPDC059835 TaxID=3346967 RepID=UPI003663CF2F